MNTIVVVLTLVALAIATPLNRFPKSARRYLPEENDPYRVKYLPVEDELGQLHYEDLTQPIPPTRATLDDITLYLYSRQNQIDGISLKVEELDVLKESQFYDSKKPNYFIIHGLNNNYQSSVNSIVKAAILKTSDSNVFVIDWSRPANKLYPIAFAAVPQIGEYLGNFINNMMDHFKLSPKMFRLIGHSLGAHVSGCAGAQVNGLVDFIVGLDPAGPLFTLGNTDNRLDESDAEFVQIVHTSGTLLGFGSSIGDADYFPNGGSNQPGCGLDVVGTCAHSRAYYYFEESILQGGFSSAACDSYKSYKNGNCVDNHHSFIGSLNIDKSASGDYYLNTAKASPFSQD